MVSGERDKIMSQVREKVDQDLKRIGVEIIDVRLKRVDLPQDVSESVYRRMEAERKRIANELRSTGAAEAEKIRADADRQREVMLAEAYRDAQRVNGEGDAKAAAHLRRRVQPEPGVLLLLPQHGGLPEHLPRPQRRDGARAELRLPALLPRLGGQALGRDENDAWAPRSSSRSPSCSSSRGCFRSSRLTSGATRSAASPQMSDGQIRFVGLSSMIVGLLLLLWRIRDP